MPSKIRRLLVDMDEVLADFIGGACRLYGADPATVLSHWTPGRWGCFGPLSAALGVCMTEGDFWARLDGNEDFWAGLEPLPWMRDVVALADEAADEWIILSSATWCPSSRTGKMEWVRRHLGWSRREAAERLCCFPRKHMFASNGVTLLDDKEEAVVRFILEGGDGLVFPRHHNGMYAHKDDPVGHLREVLGR